MALSDAEQELLAKLEATLAADDPKLAQKLAQAPAARGLHPRRATLGVLGLLLGLTSLVVGLSTSLIWISVLGFALMLAATVFFITAWRPKDPSPQTGQSRPTDPKDADSDLMTRLEQRWKDRLNP
ncbi:MAG: DUF3040 domain-containing protein [Propionibacteriaceae bacterium]|jgi:protein-S-isoprenylcysteine O-methyltransferase Ste14|nr:DUF3040 domain-containing protein [Propionibacteriaceae bacterium]